MLYEVITSLETGKQVAETILALAPETNGATAVKSWKKLEEKTVITSYSIHYTKLYDDSR